mgnify:CR=1 FL=1
MDKLYPFESLWWVDFKYAIFRSSLLHCVTLGNRVHTSHDLARTSLMPTVEQLVAIAKGWLQMKLVTTKVMSNLFYNFLMTQISHILFHNICSTNYELSELYQSKWHKESSETNIKRCTSLIWLWCGIIMLHFNVT